MFPENSSYTMETKMLEFSHFTPASHRRLHKMARDDHQVCADGDAVKAFDLSLGLMT